MTSRWFLLLFGALLALALTAAGLVGVAIALTYPRLPSLETLTDYRPKIPLRVYTSDGVQIGEFGEERRAFVPIAQVPALMKQAILAAEDERFYEHGGVDFIGIVRAFLSNVAAGHVTGGASTITQQVARNFFLSSEQTYTRKFNEALLAYKIESNLSKNQILEIYFNQIYLGQRAYGFASAAQIYYGKTLGELTPAEMAMLAGLPKAPSSYNPVVNPKRALLRQRYVLRRMRELRFINDAQYAAAINEPIRVRRATDSFPIHAEYVAEMARQAVVDKYKDAAYTQGIKVYTTLLAAHQTTAWEASRAGLMAYDRRRGYRGPEGFVDASRMRGAPEEWAHEVLADYRDVEGMTLGVVTAASNKRVDAVTRQGTAITVEGVGLRFASRALNDKLSPAKRLRPGAVIRLAQSGTGWEIVQVPEAEVAFVSMDPQQGAIRALVGGFDFNRNHFNRVTQAWRQPGSSFKPFIYSAALDRGLTAATQINDAPLVIDPALVGGQRWDPKNFDNKFEGMMTMRRALIKSKNLVSIRILQAITPEFAQSYIGKFGFSPQQHPAYLTMALGAGSVTPLQLAEGYAVFANTGYRVHAYFIDRIEDSRGNVLAKTQPEVAGQNATRTLDPRNAFIMTSMMHDVTRFGTAAKVNALGRNDLAGKTGTTSDSRDAWFAGYQPGLVAVAWIGFDQPRSLGSNETGGAAALPIWIDYMGKMLKGVPDYQYPVPEGIVVQTVEGENGPYTEYFLSEFTETNAELGLDNRASGPAIDEATQDQLF
jgi:penicillin-binding protein 1A